MAELKITSKLCPKGVFKFCAITGIGILNEDASTRKEDVYEYKATLEVDEKDAADFMDAVDDLVDGELSKGDDIVKLPYQTHDDYDGIPKGKVWIAAKCKTSYIGKDDEEVDVNVNVYDTGGNKCKLPEGVGIGSGSTGKVYGKVVTWDKKEGIGATLYLSSVQLADFVPYEFGDQVDEAMEGSFKGFATPQLEKDEAGDEEESPRRSRRDRNKSTEQDDDKPSRRPRRSR